jgi:MraZ protein
VDEKGRLKLPAEFKRICDEKYGPKFYITSLDGQRAEIFPMLEWEKIEAQIAEMAGPEKKRFLYAAARYGQNAEMDAQGRLLIPQLLRETATLAGDVAVLGLQTYLAVANDEKHRTALKENPLTDADMDALGVVGV